MEREDMKGRVTLTVIGAATLLVALAGATFAYFSATSTTTTQQVTTSNLNLNVAANGDATHVTNIKPTTWDESVMENNISNEDVVQIPFKVTGTSSIDGTYAVDLETVISLNAGTVVENQGGEAVELKGGDVSDIKYRLYDGDEEIIGETAFEATTKHQILKDKPIIANQQLIDTYVLYVYVKDSGDDQNKLQDIDFTITLNGKATQNAQ